ncbi:glycosyltransferase family 28 C-terminal domain-containing protein [Boeremia exigua]|uniref:glycosyltransferase family 28 C-terminal domain-containing protein n=1 Tax=Boeremia exigua TaxID=749465 RepID=UPI001E8E46B0|nr:glycosyltransferase family 28 C-terminal domain-containing protein [Boeremia exigua]KAH6633043.1 glycosyltransferase family 28 C-terminal domain-containing protein [Boeremia exigua]
MAAATSNSKLCFVTTGATAPFEALIESVLSPSSLDALLESGYTHLLVQYGSAEDVYTDAATIARSHVHDKLTIDGLDFNPDGLQAQLKLVQQSNGLTISHAGSGSILEVLRYQIPLVVVPNTSLLDNHQEELAVAMERSGYLLRGYVEDLGPTIRQSDEFRTKMSQFPPITSGKHRETKSFAAIMDETDRDSALPHTNCKMFIRTTVRAISLHKS